MNISDVFWAFQVQPPSGLKASERLVLLFLGYHKNQETGQCNPSIDLLAQETGQDRKTVMRALKSLEEKELIAKERKNILASQSYFLRSTNFGTTTNGTTDSRSTNFGTPVVPKKVLPKVVPEVKKSEIEKRNKEQSDSEADLTLSLFKKFCPSLPSPLSLNKFSHEVIRERWDDIEARTGSRDKVPGFLEDYFKRLERSDFVTNRNGRRANPATLESVLTKNFFEKALLGKYDNQDEQNADVGVSEDFLAAFKKRQEEKERRLAAQQLGASS